MRLMFPFTSLTRAEGQQVRDELVRQYRMLRGEFAVRMVFVPSLGAYVTPRILGGGKKMMIGNFIELQFLQGKNWPLGAALSVLLLIIVTAALLVYVRVANRDRESGNG